MKKLDIVGAGLSGCTLAYLLKDKYDITIYEKEITLGGLCREGRFGRYKYHRFGGHFFHTNKKKIAEFLYTLTHAPEFRHRAMTVNSGKYYDYPITHSMVRKFGKKKCYEMFIDNYSKKMWGKDVPKVALDRVRIAKKGETFFTDKYQYSLNYTELFYNLTKGIKVFPGWKVLDVGNCVLTGEVDEYFGYKFGRLGWRGLRWETSVEDEPLPAHTINYPEEGFPYIRKNDYSEVYRHYLPIIGTGFPTSKLHHYPVETPKNMEIFEKYKEEAKKRNVILLGRLATYHYLNMDEAIWEAMKLAKKLR